MMVQVRNKWGVIWRHLELEESDTCGAEVQQFRESN